MRMNVISGGARALDEGGPARAMTPARALKRCPQCGALVFEDMPVCFNCLYEFGRTPAPEALGLPPADALVVHEGGSPQASEPGPGEVEKDSAVTGGEVSAAEAPRGRETRDAREAREAREAGETAEAWESWEAPNGSKGPEPPNVREAPEVPAPPGAPVSPEPSPPARPTDLGLPLDEPDWQDDERRPAAAVPAEKGAPATGTPIAPPQSQQPDLDAPVCAPSAEETCDLGELGLLRPRYGIRIRWLGLQTVVPLSQAGLTIGRDPSSDVVVPEAPVSRRHVRVALTGTEVSVEDAGARNPAFLDEEPLVGRAVWLPGSTLRVCGASFMLLMLDPRGEDAIVNGRFWSAQMAG